MTATPQYPKADTWDVCSTCGQAIRWKNRSTGWVHSILGRGRDHRPTPTEHPDAEPVRPMDAATAFDNLDAATGRRPQPALRSL